MEPDVQSYYHQTRFDYRMIWSGRKNRAVHFGFYDEHASKHHDALHNMNRVMAELARIRAGEQVLDAGCGIGSACFWLEENRNVQVKGIGIVPSQLDDCRKEAALRKSGRISFEYADFCNMPFPDASFDVVWACESVCHARNKETFYREASRVLRPGGRLVMADFIRTARPVTSPGEALLEAWLRPWAIPDIDTETEHRGYAKSAGFTIFECRNVTPHVRVSLRNLHALCTRWLPIGKVLRFFRIVNDLRLNNVSASIRQYEALEEGAWYYGMVLAEKK